MDASYCKTKACRPIDKPYEDRHLAHSNKDGNTIMLNGSDARAVQDISDFKETAWYSLNSYWIRQPIL